MEPLDPVNNKKAYLVLFASWISYIIQIIIILSLTLNDMKYYQDTMVYFDLGLFLVWCGVCIFISYAFARNKSLYYKAAIIISALYDGYILILIFHIFNDITLKYPGNSKNTLLLLIKIIEIIPTILIFINAKLINRPNNNVNNNNYEHLNNNNNFVNNNNGFMNNNNNGFMYNNNGIINYN